MRVAIFTDNDFEKTNGVTTTLRALLRYAPADLQPRIYTMSDLATDTQEYLALASIGVPIPWYREMRMYVPRLRAFRKHLEADKVGLIHLTTPGPAGLAAKYLSAKLMLPTIGSFHTHLAEYTTVLSGSPRLGRWMNLYMRWLYGHCERVLVPSEATRDTLRDLGWTLDRMSIWSRGVDPIAFAPSRRSPALREQWGVGDKRPAIMYAGRISREKGLALLQPFDSLLYRHHVPYRLILAGDGPMMADLRSACPDAIFLGRLAHDDMGAAMASADLLLFPSDTDTAGNVVLEAQACGLPVLVSEKGGPREQIVNGTTGFACRPGDALDFGGRAIELLRSKERRTEMAMAARAHALARNWKSAFDPLFSAYRVTLAAHARQGELALDARAGMVAR
jgi:glycosyltransferase involved in cell wall biosynthesis